MAHEVENMMYVGETPWHNLGVKLAAPPASSLEALRAGGADFDIALRPVYIDAGADETLCKLPVPDARAIYRVQDGAHFGVVGTGWTPIQPRDAVAPIDPAIKAGATIETCGSLFGGKRVWMLAKLPLSAAVIVPVADDIVEKYMLVALGNDGTMGLRIGLTPIRVVCANTLAVALTYAEKNYVRISHWKNARNAIEAVTDTIKLWDEQFNRAAEAFRMLAGVQIRGEEQLRQYVEEVFAPAKRRAAEEAARKAADEAAAAGKAEFATLLQLSYKSTSGALDPDQGLATKETKSRVYADIKRLFEGGRGNTAKGVAGTAWAAYNAVTEFCNYERGRTDDSRLESVWMNGSSYNPATRALPAALQTFVGA